MKVEISLHFTLITLNDDYDVDDDDDDDEEKSSEDVADGDL